MPRQQDVKTFEKAMQKYGGRLDFSTHSPDPAYIHFKGQAEGYLSKVRSVSPALPDVHFDYVISSSLQAWAFIVEKQPFIAMASGSLYLFQLVFNRMLADRAVLTVFGDAQKEAANLPLYTDIMGDANRLIDTTVGFIPPRDPVRDVCVQILTQFAFDFLLMHEYGHLANGHVGLLNDVNCTHLISEFVQANDAGFNPLSPLDMQTFEMDADSFATHMGLRKLFEIVKKVDRLPEPYCALLADPERALYLWLFATHTVIRLFDVARFTQQQYESASHPPARVRQIQHMGTTRLHLSDVYKSPTLVSYYDHSGRDVVSAVESAFSKISGQSIDTEGIRRALDTWVNDRYGMILNNWAVLRPQLEKFATAPLPL